jgi:4-hydroxybenzoate polyprenyltransferase
MIGVEEDRLCKPHRPFASGRISLEHGQPLYLLGIALCTILSAFNGLTTVSLTYMMTIYLYNEVGLSVYPILKSPFGAMGYFYYGWGTTYLVGTPFIFKRSSCTN